MKFEVSIQRQITQQAFIEIEAYSKEEAYRITNLIRETMEWSATDTIYDTPEIREVE